MVEERARQHGGPASGGYGAGGADVPARFDTTIAEADGDSSALRYRGVDLDDLVGRVPFAHVWGLLVEDDLGIFLPPAESFPLPARTGDIRVDVQGALAMLAPVWGFRPLHDIDETQARAQLARASVLTISFVAQGVRSPDLPIVPQRTVDRGTSVAQRFLIRWRGEADPRHCEALDAYFVAAAEHGLAASTLTARVVASTGADVAACLSAAVGAISGPLHGGAPARVLRMLQAAERAPDPERYITDLVRRGHRVMGFGHRIYRDTDPRARTVRAICRRLDAPRYELAEAVETAALAALAERSPERPIATNLEFWAAVLLDLVEVPVEAFSSFFACARTAGWSAHILEQKRSGRPVRPAAHYRGHGPRPVTAVDGWSGTGLHT